VSNMIKMVVSSFSAIPSYFVYHIMADITSCKWYIGKWIGGGQVGERVDGWESNKYLGT